MEKLLLDLIKYSVLIFCIIYCYIKLSKKTYSYKFLLNFPICMLLSIGIHYLTANARYLIPFIILVVAIFYNLILYKDTIYSTVINSLISTGLMFFILTLSYIATIPFSMLLMNLDNRSLALIISTFLCAMCCIIFSFFTFKIKKFKNGIVLLKSDLTFTVLIFFSILIINLVSFYYTNLTRTFWLFISFFVITIVGVLILLVWRVVLANKYKNEIFKRNTKIYEETIENYKCQIEELLKNNDNLSKIIHRDNKLITAIEIANNTLKDEPLNSLKLKELSELINDLSQKRGKLVDNYSNKKHFSTDSIAIDSTLQYIDSLSYKHNISLEIVTEHEIKNSLDLLNIDMVDFTTILCDLGENAIYAVEQNAYPLIKINLGVNNNCPYITISDNGIPFAEKVLLNIGKNKVTTRKQKGGSGTGLICIFEILKKYGASFSLSEFSNENTYTKSITIDFNIQGKLNFSSNRQSLVRYFNHRTNIY